MKFSPCDYMHSSKKCILGLIAGSKLAECSALTFCVFVWNISHLRQPLQTSKLGNLLSKSTIKNNKGNYEQRIVTKSDID